MPKYILLSIFIFISNLSLFAQEEQQFSILPTWQVDQQLTYSVFKSDYFKFKETEKEPKESSYSLTLTVEEKTDEGFIIEARRQGTLLHLLDTTQFGDIFKDIPSKEGDYFRYAINDVGQIEYVEDLERVKSFFKELKPLIKKGKYNRKFKSAILADIDSILDDDETLAENLLKDIILIHDFYGGAIPLNQFVDLTDGALKEEEVTAEDLEGLTKEEQKKLQQIADSKMSEMYLVNFSSTDKTATIDFIEGIDLVSSEVRNDFPALKKIFQKGKLVIDEHDDISLVRTTHNFDRSTALLKRYHNKRRTAGPSMTKITEVKIELQ